MCKALSKRLQAPGRAAPGLTVLLGGLSSGTITEGVRGEDHADTCTHHGPAGREVRNLWPSM